MTNNLDIKRIDEDSRKLIESDTSTNYFVEAGAGSGKTTELVHRMVAMVERGVNGHAIDVSEISAITFTKAAANEFKDRFQIALKDSGTPQAIKALKNIDLCFMGTIDSFCKMILSEHPVEAKIPANATVIDEEDQAAFWLEELKNIANGAYGDIAQAKYNRFVNFVPSQKEVFVNTLKFFSSTRNCQFNYTKYDNNTSFSSLFAKEISDVKSAVNFIASHKHDFCNSSKGDKQAIKWIDIAYRAVNGNWEENFSYINNALNKISKLRFDKNTNLDNFTDLPLYLRDIFEQSFTKADKPSFWIMKDAKDGGNPFHKREFENYVYYCAVDFIYSVKDKIFNKLKSAGKMSFSDYLFGLRDMLKDDAENGGKLIKYISSRHKYFLIDEFQDTDPVQAEIFFYLTATNIDRAKNWKECIPAPGSLFIVGDPKQSIYRFRNADVASYLNVKKLFENKSVGRVLSLFKNFRSSGPMCEWFNNAFSNLLVDEPCIQSAFENIPLDEKPKYAATFKGAYKYSYVGSSLSTSPATDNLVTIINEIVSNPKYTIQDTSSIDKPTPKPRSINYGDIMVITYTRSALKHFMNALRQANIPFFIEGNVLFDDCPSLSAMLSYFNYSVDPNDVKAKKTCEYLSYTGMTESQAAQYNELSKQLNSSTLMTKLLDDFEIIGQMGTKNIEYLYYALELLKSAEIKGAVTNHKDAQLFVKQLINNETDEQRCLQLVQDSNCVHLANLHKVKGLQAPVVIMTQAKLQDHLPDKHVDFNAEIPLSYLLKLSANNNKSINNWENQDKQNVENQILDAEKLRLLYVAATRAECAFIATDFENQSGPSKQNQAIPLLEQIDQVLDVGSGTQDGGLIIPEREHQGFIHNVIDNRIEVDNLYKQSKDETAINNLALNHTYKIKKPSSEPIWQDFNENKKDLSAQTDDDKATERGSLVHRYLELLVNARCFDGFNSTLAEIALSEFNGNFSVEILKKIHDSTEELFSALKHAQEIYCEVPFSYKVDSSTICDGVIDLLFKDENGYHIVDYKTNKDPHNLEEKYKAQLSSYEHAIKSILGVNANASIQHIFI